LISVKLCEFNRVKWFLDQGVDPRAKITYSTGPISRPASLCPRIHPGCFPVSKSLDLVRPARHLAPGDHRLFPHAHGAIKEMNLSNGRACGMCSFESVGARELTTLQIAYFMRYNSGWTMYLFSQGPDAFWDTYLQFTCTAHHGLSKFKLAWTEYESPEIQVPRRCRGHIH
jgi:hypothetical protein